MFDNQSNYQSTSISYHYHFQPSPSPNDDSCLISKVGISLFSHFSNNWKPHNPKFPSKDELWNVQNCPPCEIGSINWFWERFKYSRNVRLVSCWGILPKRRFQERSKDSSAISVVKFWSTRKCTNRTKV